MHVHINQNNDHNKLTLSPGLASNCQWELTKPYMIIPYPRERGPIGGAPYIGARLGGADIRGISIAFIRERAPR